MKPFVYADYAAATPLDEEVLNKMLPFFTSDFGNASTIYEFGQKARRALDLSRRDVAEILHCTPKEVIFTGSGTESIHLAIRGVTEAYKEKGNHIITSTIEHHAVLHTCQYLEKNGYEVTYLQPDKDGIINPEDVQKALRPETILVTIMYANNEIGTVQDIPAIGKIIQTYRAEKGLQWPFFHTDACQAPGFLDINAENLGVDLLTINGSKIYGPKGVGALFIKRGVRVAPQIIGGGQEYRLRAGTENVPAVVGMAEALKKVIVHQEEEKPRIQKLRDLLIHEIETRVPQSTLNGSRTQRLPNNVHCSFDGIEGETILLRLDMEGICASSGSACTSGTVDPSHVLLALGVPYERAHGSVRFSLGRQTTEKDVMFIAEKMEKIIKEMREISPLFEQK